MTTSINHVENPELVLMFGASGAGKSFAALDLAFSVALGQPRFGMRFKKGRAFYVSPVGTAGISKRVAAGFQNNVPPENMPSGLPLEILTDSPNLLCKVEVEEFCRSINAQSQDKTSMVIFDGLAFFMVGADENSGAVMRVLRRHCQYIHESTGATVVLVDVDGAATVASSLGWNYLRATADFELTVTRKGKKRHLHVNNLVDGERGPRMGFSLKPVEVGRDADGDPVTSCVVVPEKLQKKPVRPRVLIKACNL